MRIVSGYLKGQRLKGYQLKGIRPTMSRGRESLMAVFQFKLKGAVVLDLFAGSGAFGIEALSNGADKVYFVDHNLNASACCRDNLEKLGIRDKAMVLTADWKQALTKFKGKGLQFDLIFLDPPYQLHYLSSILEVIVNQQLVKPKGYVVCEFEQYEFKVPSLLKLIKSKRYGDKRINIYQLSL